MLVNKWIQSCSGRHSRSKATVEITLKGDPRMHVRKWLLDRRAKTKGRKADFVA